MEPELAVIENCTQTFKTAGRHNSLVPLYI